MKKQPDKKKIDKWVYYNIPFIAKKCGISYNTVWQWIHKKQLKAVKMGAWYVKREWLDEFLQTHPDQRN